MTRDAHHAPEGAASEPALDLAVPAPSHAERARTLLEGAASGALCTLAREPAGYPYGSLVLYALDRGSPVFLISRLAEHTQNLLADPRASLLVAESRPGDPLANGRVTLLGSCTLLAAEQRAPARAAYLARHPGASGYDGFQDFSYWRLDVHAVRYIGGYGRMSWVKVDDWQRAEPDPLRADSAAILEHMNQDHADALPLYCRAFARTADVLDVRMTSIDRLGFEMSAVTRQGTRTLRVAFHEPIASKADARRALVGLLQEARAKLGVA